MGETRLSKREARRLAPRCCGGSATAFLSLALQLCFFCRGAMFVQGDTFGFIHDLLPFCLFFRFTGIVEIDLIHIFGFVIPVVVFVIAAQIVIVVTTVAAYHTILNIRSDGLAAPTL